MNKAIEDILKYFDFKTMQKVMQFLDWHWYSSELDSKFIPSQNDLYQEAKELLLQLEENDCGSLEAGCFIAERDGDNYRLIFSITDYDSEGNR